MYVCAYVQYVCMYERKYYIVCGMLCVYVSMHMYLCAYIPYLYIDRSPASTDVKAAKSKEEEGMLSAYIYRYIHICIYVYIRRAFTQYICILTNN